MIPDIRIEIDLSGLKKFQNQLDAGLKQTSGPVHDALKQWAARYRSAMQERFDKFSKGGGNWAALAPSTIEGRRHGKGGGFKRGKRAAARAKATGGGGVSILRDTGTLFNTLDPQFTRAPGQLEERVPYGIRVGFGGPAKHPKGKATIVDIAVFHQFGMGRNPKREILIEPPANVLQLMVGDMERALKKVIRKSQVK